jgi:two-component sensor histidine kinase
MPLASALVHDDEALQLSNIPDLGPLDRIETVQTDLGLGGLALRTSIRSAPITSSFLVALMLPLLMWAAAAGLSWFIVDRLLIRPLRRLRASVASYTPGEVIDPGKLGPLPAQEIRELGDTFRAISRTVALHEAGLAEAVVRQTKLTREVHHRVKNNLQVISSLINFHARGAPSADAAAAYASIQRRVDALAVVHRNHFAEMEDNRGLNLRAVIGELSSNIRATAPEGATSLSIALDIDPYLVNQDVAVAVAFLVTETIELAMNCDAAAQIRVAVKPGDDEKRAKLRVVSRAFVASETLETLLSTRYGRVMEGLSRQLRSPLHHDPMTGAYEISIAVLGRD